MLSGELGHLEIKGLTHIVCMHNNIKPESMKFILSRIDGDCVWLEGDRKV